MESNIQPPNNQAAVNGEQPPAPPVSPGWTLVLSDLELMACHDGLAMIAAKLYGQAGLNVSAASTVAALLARINPGVQQAYMRMEEERQRRETVGKEQPDGMPPIPPENPSGGAVVNFPKRPRKPSRGGK
ncbi:MAG: hypothetical protein L0220_02800 [Acidobacteria bacterium]|nr:hypothetical protein [Acidobacteriota bacterium]